MNNARGICPSVAGKVWQGRVRRGVTRFGVAGEAGCGKVRHGQARLGRRVVVS